MPTFNQLVRKGRKDLEVKSTAPALQKGYNAKKKVQINQSSPQKRGDFSPILQGFLRRLV